MPTHDDLTQDVKTKAHDLGNNAKEAIYSEAERKTEQLRDAAAEKVTNAANAADAAANEFGSDSLQARAAHQIADQVEGLASRLRTVDLNTATRDVSNFARQHPALFIGGAALLGFAATRFLKARDPARVDYDNAARDPWSAQGTPNATTRGFDVPS
ncbi:hypothetical protein [uncultured Sulfitobacter sp.]|uniref:hypothetical protein n=1 Tax=uncultured Sulfitobacter sp. TaxID=191468 RepID=UPI002628FFC4|nr:hypothetical protein [uncultured Sulfitobacter sp.]